MESTFVEQLNKLEEMGFAKRTQNLKLLKKTNGNFDLVVNFLSAKLALHQKNEHNRLPKTKINKPQKKCVVEPLPTSTPVLKKEGTDSLDSTLIQEFALNERRIKKEKRLLEKEATKEKPSCSKGERKKLSKEERDELKKKKAQEKALKKEEKLALRQEKVKEKDDHKKCIDLPNDVDRILLDGNNLLFSIRFLRENYLKDRKAAEKLLETLVRRWLEKVPQIKMCALIFESTSSSSFVEDRISVLSASPFFKTSGDSILHLAQNADDSEKMKWMVFSMDVEMRKKLNAAGVRVLKAKKFFEIARKDLSADESSNENSGKPKMNVDTWVGNWFSQIPSNH
jgi:hypothetical protein